MSAFALSTIEMKVDKMVFLTCPGKVSWVFNEFKETVGLGDKAIKLMISRSERILKENLDQVSVLSKLKQTNFNSLELIHDRHDKVLPYSNSTEIVEELSNTRLHTFEKVGHYRMLWNPDIIGMVGDLLKKEEKELPIEMKVA